MSRAGVAAITGNVDAPSPAKPGSMEEAIRIAPSFAIHSLSENNF
jgi:hypothetical protein